MPSCSVNAACSSILQRQTVVFLVMCSVISDWILVIFFLALLHKSIENGGWT